MSTKERFSEANISKANHIFSQTRTTVQTAFFQNNMEEVTSPAQAYYLAQNNPNTIVLDTPIVHTKELGLPNNAKMLVDNHGQVVGRTAAARHRIDDPKEDATKLNGILRDAIYQGHKRHFYKTSVYVGLDSDFTLKAHLALAQGFEVNLLSYMLNFQVVNKEYHSLYQKSKVYDEGDLYIYADPEWQNPDYPNGLVIIDAPHNVAAILGLRYFGELKKSTLTLAWATAHRNGYTACHGGEKAFHFTDKDDKVFAFFGLSGSGKSTLTHAKHDGRFDITVLHDDAFVISRENGTSVALEPSYFDKTNDYLPGSEESRYFTTLMNVGVTLNEKGEKVFVSEDLRNGNGRTIKSRYASVNRVDKEAAPLSAIFWIMKDDSLPPVVKISDPIMAATFGATLATKRSTAENVIGSDRNTLVIEPFADPFRAYPLKEDYQDFKELFEKRDVDCYIVNTGNYNGLDVTKEVTLASLEKIANDQAKFQNFGNLPGLAYIAIDGYPVDFTNQEYVAKLKSRLETRKDWLTQYDHNHPGQELPDELDACLSILINKLA